MRYFQIGDRVKRILDPNGPVPVGAFGTVYEAGQCPRVAWDDYPDFSGWNFTDRLWLVCPAPSSNGPIPFPSSAQITQEIKAVSAATQKAKMRTFSTGATRNLSDNKLDYEGFLSPLSLERYAQYMHKHRKQADGTLRDSDNWQKGIPIKEYMKSLWRHVFDVWKQVRGLPGEDSFEDSICAAIFNLNGMLHEHLKRQTKVDKTPCKPNEAIATLRKINTETCIPADELKAAEEEARQIELDQISREAKKQKGIYD